MPIRASDHRTEIFIEWHVGDAIVNNYPLVIKALSDISEEWSGLRSINVCEKSIFIITSFIRHKLFSLIKVLSDHLSLCYFLDVCFVSVVSN
jgi:hypothetical protein